MKKLVSLFLALMMVFSLATAVAATSGSSTTLPANGMITINGLTLTAENSQPVATYKVYQMLDLESYNTTSGAYSYKVNSKWTNFFTEGTGALNYVTIDASGYVTWVAAEDDDTVADFAKLALAYAKEHEIDHVRSTTNVADYTCGVDADTGITFLRFSNLPLGYYLVDSSIGALCGLTTTNTHAELQAKNHIPSLDKQVQEDSTGQWGAGDTADIGQIIHYRTTINVAAGAENFVLHDKMTAGLTFDKVVKIEHVIPGTDKAHEVPSSDYTVVTEGLSDQCTFEVRFTPEFCEKLSANDKVIVYYDAMLNRNAVIAGNGNTNDSWLQYGDQNYTTHDATTTKTYRFDIVKTDSQNFLIDGATFRIYDAETGGNEVAVVPLMAADNTTPVLDAKGNPMYRRARADETGVDILVKDGKVTVIGFDNGTYYLEEVAAPAGYNKLTSRIKFIIADANLDSVFSAEGNFSVGSGVHVVNKTGTMLPETGAMGTTMFIFFGALVVLSTGVLLVTKKRMTMIQE